MRDINHLLHLMLAYSPRTDTDLVRRAFFFSEEAHKDQKRLSGEEYANHPYEAALILAEHRFDDVTIAAGLLHDVVEDCGVTREQLSEEFGPEVASLVEGVTKISTVPFNTRQEYQAENLRRMLVAMARDIRVLVIKLADRLHNMRTIEFLDEEKRRRVARETMDIHAQLAARMGMFAIKEELEDRCFQVLNPEAYYGIEEHLRLHQAKREEWLEHARALMEKELAKVGITAVIQGRPKRIYSIHQKMIRKSLPLDEIFDLVGIRVLVGTVRDCYGALGVVHTLWRPIPRRFKDYIATPKPNMYQALHTTVSGPDEKPLEVQIKTHAMQLTAEEGIAAHWRYKAGEVETDERFGWLRRMLEWQQETKDPKEFMESLSIELFSDRVFVFTPRGDIKELPTGSTPIDMAYEIHSEVGDRCAGARVNGQIVPLREPLRNGDVVEIITAKNAEPSQDWLKFVKTPKARNKIRHYNRIKRQDEMIAIGKEELEREIGREGLQISLDPPDKTLIEVAGDLTYHSLDELLAGIGFGRESAKNIITRYQHKTTPAPSRTVPPPPREGAMPRREPSGLRIRGAEGMLIRLSRCCNPLPGDPIVGYVTRGRGVAIHREDCPNAAQFRSTPERMLEVSWDLTRTEKEAKFVAVLEVVAEDRVGLFADETSALSALGANIISADVKTSRGRKAVSRFAVEVSDQARLQKVMASLENVPGVQRVRRAIPSSS